MKKNELTLSLSEPVSFTEEQTHYVALRQKNDSLSGPFVVSLKPKLSYRKNRVWVF